MKVRNCRLVVNPFVSEAQRRACYAKDDPNWDCHEWSAHTPKGKKLPKRKRGSKPTTNKLVSILKRKRGVCHLVGNYNPDQIRDEYGRWVSGGGGKSEDVKTPFARAHLPNAIINSVTTDHVRTAPTVEVNLKDLSSSQPDVDLRYVHPHVTQVGLPGRGSLDDLPQDIPIVISYRGANVIFDGHHRLVGRVLAGDTRASVKLINGDAFDRKKPTANARKKRPNALRIDPTRTITLRRKFASQLKAKFSAIKVRVLKLIVGENALGLTTNCQPGQLRGADGKCGPGVGVSIPRDKMPQIKRDDLSEFSQWVRSQGIGFSGDQVKITDLSPTQSQFRKERVDALPDETEPILISRDDYILDGTHRWIKEWQKDQNGHIDTNRIDLPLQDALDLMRRFPKVQFATNTRWQFATSSEQVQAFQAWLKQQLASTLRNQTEEELWHRYALAGYLKGAGRAFDDVNAKRRSLTIGADDDSKKRLDFYNGSREQFLRDSFARPVAVDKVKLLAGRSFDDLEGVTDQMSLRMSRTLTDGLVEGKSPRDIGRDLAEEVDLGMERALTVARTEIIRTHAEGQLDAMEALGVEQVGVAVEWSTTGDDKVCEECEPLEGVVLDIDEARNMIPRHPNCRCAWVPANVGEDSKDQTRSKSGIEAAFKESGLDERVSKSRPESVLNQWVTLESGQHVWINDDGTIAPEGPKETPTPKAAGATKHAATNAVLAEYHAATGKAKNALDVALYNAGYDPTDPPKSYKGNDRKLAGALTSAWLETQRMGMTAEEVAPVERALKAVGARKVGNAGDVVPFDGRWHESDHQVSTGQRVRVKTAGWTLDEKDGGTYRLVAAKVGRLTTNALDLLDLYLLNRSFFADCDRDERGHCLPSGEGGEHRVSDEEHLAAQKQAQQKAKDATKPTQEEVDYNHEQMDTLGADKFESKIRGNSKDRAASRKRLLEEFGDGTHCPCVYCGLKLDKDSVTRDKIYTAREGGRYRHDNLVPACLSCNKSRGDVPFKKIKWRPS